MILETLHQLYRYNGWANRRMLEAADDLTPAELNHDLGGSFPSVHKTVLHILWVEMLFLRRWQKLSTADWTEPPLLQTVAAIQAKWSEVEKDRAKFLEKLGEGDLSQPLSYVDTRGRSISMPLVQTLLHLINHSTYHRGQLAAKLRQLGKVPPSTDYILFCREAQ